MGVGHPVNGRVGEARAGQHAPVLQQLPRQVLEQPLGQRAVEQLDAARHHLHGPAPPPEAAVLQRRLGERELVLVPGCCNK